MVFTQEHKSDSDASYFKNKENETKGIFFPEVHYMMKHFKKQRQKIQYIP
jgi:hypothetical protein